MNPNRMNKGSIRFKPSANDPTEGRWYLDFRDGSPLIRCEQYTAKSDRPKVDAWRNQYVATMVASIQDKQSFEVKNDTSRSRRKKADGRRSPYYRDAMRDHTLEYTLEAALLDLINGISLEKIEPVNGIRPGEPVCGQGDHTDLRDKWREIYVLKAGGFIKVGISTDVRTRLKTIQSNNPERVSGLIAFPGKSVHEEVLKRRLDDAGYHVRGEWFVDVPETADFCNRLHLGLVALADRYEVGARCEFLFHVMNGYHRIESPWAERWDRKALAS